jgi:hypothetical protein
MSEAPTPCAGDRSVRMPRRRTTLAACLACGLAAAPFVASALPVIPNGVGYGMETPAGRGGKIFRVTNLNASGAGSLKECIQASGPRVCIFEVSGTIKLTSDLHIWNPYITIAGQTAPSPGITIRGAALQINTSDVLVQHLRFRVGDDPEGPPFGNRDALIIDAGPNNPKIKNIVVDHCSFAWALDETVTLWENWTDVTLTNNIIAEGLHERSDGKASGYGLMLAQTGGGKATIAGNLLAHNYARNPVIRSYDSIFVNNVIYNAGWQAMALTSMNDVPTKNSVVGNVFIKGPDSSNHAPIWLRRDQYPLPSTAKVYLSDNHTIGYGVTSTDPWAAANASEVPSSIKASSPPIWLQGLTAMPTSNNAVLNSVLTNAGARPADRDSVDARIVRSVRDRTGRILNCVKADGTKRCEKNAGGWPTLAQNRRALVLPADHNSVTSSGYTKLELWLHEMAAAVEGRTTTAKPKSPVLTVE